MQEQASTERAFAPDRWLETHWTPAVAWCVAGALAVLLVLVSPYTGHRGGETDQVAYVLQAQIIASGHLSVPSPPQDVRTFFLTRHCVSNGRFFAHYWPLTSVLFALPLSLSVSWYVMHAALYALAGAFAYMALRGTTGGAVAGAFGQLGVYALLAERAWTANSMVPAVACAMLALWAARVTLAQWRVGWGALCGLGCGLAFLARPLTGAVLGTCIGVGLLIGALRVRGRWRAVLGFGVCVVLCGVVLLAYSRALTGSALRPPFYVYAPENRMFFGMRGFQDPIVWFGPKDALANLRDLLSEWWFLLAACVLASTLLWPRSLKADPVVPIALASGVALGLLYCCYFGFRMTMPRYLREIGSLLVLSYAWVGGRLASWRPAGKPFPARRLLSISLALFFVVSAAVSLGFQAATSVVRTKRFKQTLAKVDRIVGDGPAVVVLRRPPNENPSERNWRLGGGPVTYFHNDPWLSGNRLYAVEREGGEEALFERYGGSRKLFLLRVDEDTGEVEDCTPDRWRTAPAPNHED